MSDTYGAEFGGLLKSFRERTRLSQSKLAERAEYDHSFVSRLESGARMPTRDAVDRIARAMTLTQVETDSLLAAAGFLPRDVTSLIADEPVVGEVLDLLQDEGIAPAYRESLRVLLRVVAQQARMMPTILVAVER